MPRHQDVEHDHREGQACPKVTPDAMPDLLEMAHHGQHGEHTFHNHADIPSSARAGFHVGRGAVFRMGFEQPNKRLLKRLQALGFEVTVKDQSATEVAAEVQTTTKQPLPLAV